MADKDNMSPGSNEQMFGKKEQVPGRRPKRLRPGAAQERASAMNNLEYVRKCMRIRRTPNKTGTKLTIEFTYYDNGFVSIAISKRFAENADFGCFGDMAPCCD